jgi:hypothetical protein
LVVEGEGVGDKRLKYNGDKIIRIRWVGKAVSKGLKFKEIRGVAEIN